MYNRCRSTGGSAAAERAAFMERIRMCEDCRVEDIYGDDGDSQIRIEPPSSGRLP